MSIIKKVLLIPIIVIVFSQSSTFRVEGDHSLIQTDGVGLYEAIDLCLKQAIINGVFNYLITENEFTEEEKSVILSKLAPVVEMCVMDPNILEQNINGNTIYVRAEGQVDPMIVNSILGSE